jgi:hypothetical protein
MYHTYCIPSTANIDTSFLCSATLKLDIGPRGGSRGAEGPPCIILIFVCKSKIIRPHGNQGS